MPKNPVSHAAVVIDEEIPSKDLPKWLNQFSHGLKYLLFLLLFTWTCIILTEGIDLGRTIGKKKQIWKWKDKCYFESGHAVGVGGGLNKTKMRRQKPRAKERMTGCLIEPDSSDGNKSSFIIFSTPWISEEVPNGLTVQSNGRRRCKKHYFYDFFYVYV